MSAKEAGVEDSITFTRPDGRQCHGFFAPVGGGPDVPGVVVLQEWWGVDDNIKNAARRFASLGYRTLAPDLYHGKVTLEAAEAEHLMHQLDFGAAVSQDMRGAVQFLKQRSQKVGVVGFCMGGALAVMAAIHIPEVDAVSAWYGVPPPEAGDPRTIRVPFEGHFASIDKHFPPAVVDRLDATLTDAGVPHEFHRYESNHGFANEDAPYHDPAASALAWQRCERFLAKWLR
jgi:carboxymethylenebutenolidase